MNLLTHLQSRHFDLTLYPTVCVSQKDMTVTMPLYSFDGRFVGYQQYNPMGDKKAKSCPRSGKYFTHLSSPGVWGLEYKSTKYPKLLVVCEGIFKACRFHNYDIQAIAVLGKNPVPLAIQLYLLSLTYRVVVVADPDKSGLELCPYAPECLVPSKPIDELSELEVQQLVEKMT